jgi:hypothetical protein
LRIVILAGQLGTALAGARSRRAATIKLVTTSKREKILELQAGLKAPEKLEFGLSREEKSPFYRLSSSLSLTSGLHPAPDPCVKRFRPL